MGYYLLHGGSADHSSEDRIRGLCQLLPEQPEVYTNALEEDWHYGLAALAGLTRNRPGLAARRIKRGDWCVTSQPHGADRLRHGTRTVLWGWAPAGEIGHRQARELSRFHRIVVTEQRSIELLRRCGVERNVRLGPDPAFLIKRQLRPLNGAFRQDTVGLCVSPAAGRFERMQGLLFSSYCHLIRWILKNTDWQIALIPYCVKTRCNDKALHRAIRQQFEGEDRLLCREDGDCRVLRGDLSLCRCCVGTAGVPAAWSCGVPGVCIGSGSRVQGLADTLFASRQESVVRVSSLKDEADLTWRFVDFLRKEDALRQWLEVSLPRYRQWAEQWQWCGWESVRMCL